MTPLAAVLALVAVFSSFTVSAAAGLGGSLILVPALALIIGTKHGIALAALLLAANNVVKVAAYRATLPYRRALIVIVVISLGAAVGASLLVAAPDSLVTVTVIAMFVGTLLAERYDLIALQRVGAPTLAFVSGATSGFSGTSGPLKGVAIRNLRMDRRHFVGAASLASLAGDATKAAVFAEASLLSATDLRIAVAAIPLMIVGTLSGRYINRELGERGYRTLFWAVMAGYTARLLVRL
ncbi:MAG TPA: sulfite exporter TauE/SafE family protein [Euzebyales bacterium]